MINLLPPESKEKSRLSSLSYSVTLIYVVVGAAILLGAAALGTYNLTQQASLSDRQDRLSQLNQERATAGDTEKEAAFIDDRLKSQGSYQDSTDWNALLNLVASATPVNLTLKSIKLSVDGSGKTTLSVQGNSPERRTVVLFQDKLATESGLSSPTITSLSEIKAGSSSSFDFTIEAGIQKNGNKK